MIYLIKMDILRILFILFPLVSKAGAAVKPHILFIVADDLGWNDVSWNNPEIIMPTLDKLARKGVILNSTYVQPTCSPSRGSLMTGYFPYHLGMQQGAIEKFQPKFMPGDIRTLPEGLKEMGYATHMVGKWHLGFCNWKYTPTKRGFDSFYGFYTGAQDYYDHTHYGGYDFRYNTSVHHPLKGRYSTSLFANRAAEIVSNHNKEQPLFLYLSFQGVHSPLQAPKRYTKLYKHIKNKNRRIYNGMVTAMDEAVKKVMTALRKYKLTQNLLVVFTSDNGGASYVAGSNWPLRGSKTTLWEGGTRVPAFVYSKSLLKKTSFITNEMIHMVDWYPTLLRLAGIRKAEERRDGVDQWMTISKGWPSARSEFVYNINEVTGSAAIRVGDYKLIVGSPGRYNGWYPARIKPACHARQKGYHYQLEDRLMKKDALKDKYDALSNNGWFTRSLGYLRSSILKAVHATGVSKAYSALTNWYKKYRCDKFNYAHKVEARRFKPSHIQLYNIKDDPLEKHNIAAKKPLLLKKMLKRLQQYKKTLVPAFDPKPSKWGHPKFFDGIWSPGWC